MNSISPRQRVALIVALFASRVVADLVGAETGQRGYRLGLHSFGSTKGMREVTPVVRPTSRHRRAAPRRGSRRGK